MCGLENKIHSENMFDARLECPPPDTQLMAAGIHHGESSHPPNCPFFLGGNSPIFQEPMRFSHPIHGEFP